MSPGLSASVIAEFTCTTNRVIRECCREIYLCHQGYLRVLSQNLPAPIGITYHSFDKRTCIRVIVCYSSSKLTCMKKIHLFGDSRLEGWRKHTFHNTRVGD